MIEGARVGGIGSTLSYLDTLEITINENTPNENDLKESMAEAAKYCLTSNKFIINGSSRPSAAPFKVLPVEGGMFGLRGGPPTVERVHPLGCWNYSQDESLGEQILVRG